MKVAFRVYGQSRGASDSNWDVVSAVLHCQASYLHQLEVADTKLTTELTMLRVYQRRSAEGGGEGTSEGNPGMGGETELEAGRTGREQWCASFPLPSSHP